MTGYPYRPLNPTSREIRLVRLEGSPDFDPEAVVLRLRHGSLAPEENFDALSYAWGDGKTLFEITIVEDNNVYTSHVRKNLYEFFRTAKRSGDNWSQHWIWIDQICINQRDHDERCQQVSQMADLYSMARTTIVWPGPTTYATTYDGAENESEDIYSPQQLEHISRTGLAFTDDMEEHIPSASAMRLLSMTSTNLLTTVYSSPYWERLWIIQEISLASQVQVLFLDELWEFCDVVFAFRQWAKNHKHPSFRKLGGWQSEVQILRWRSRQWLVQRHNISMGRKQNWLTALQVGTFAQFTEPLDRVYALQGLVQDDLRVVPAYNISARELLKAILQKEAQKSFDGIPDPWSYLNSIIGIWLKQEEFDFSRPAGWVTEPPVAFESSLEGNPEARHDRTVHNVSLVLEELQIPASPELEAKRVYDPEQ